MSDPFVSIIMRSFNEAWALRETLPALRAQDYKNWELIVIDSGSTDGSVELIESLFVDDGFDLAGDAARPGMLVQHDDFVGAANHVGDGIAVEREQGS